MSLKKRIEDRIFKFVMHSGDEKKKRSALKRQVAHIGNGTRIFTDSFGAEPYLLWIGDNVIVASGVKFIEHDASYYTAYRYLKEVGRAEPEHEKMGAIILENNCFIGAYSIILGGTKIGKDSIIAAGSVVHGIIPEGEVWGGVPAKFIMTTSEYAQKVKNDVEKLPWAYSSNTLSKDTLKKMRCKYYFSLLEKDTD